MRVLALCAPLIAAATRSDGTNMNGNYVLSKTPDAPEGKSFPTSFSDYPGGVEYFEAYHGPINTTYGQVWWTSSTDALPEEIVRRFDGKVMAIVGIEMDQVRKGAGPNGTDVSVPINAAYNHHHNTMIVGKSAHMEEVSRDDARVAAAGRYFMSLSGGARVWLPVQDRPSAAAGVPTSAMFDDANGGEYRKSMHVYAPPFAQLVESPSTISGVAMQIDTWHRDAMNLSGGSAFVSGPVPRQSLAPTQGPDAIYSGLLECPLTTRIQKIPGAGISPAFNGTFEARGFDCFGNGTGGPAFVRGSRNVLSGTVDRAGDNSTDGLSVALGSSIESAAACGALCSALGVDGSTGEFACKGWTYISSAYSQADWRGYCYGRLSWDMPTLSQPGLVSGVRPPPARRSCEHGVPTAAECFAAAAALPGLANLSLSTATVSDSAAPPGCSVTVPTSVDGAAAAPAAVRAIATFNGNLTSRACCNVGSRSDVAGSAGALNDAVALSLSLAGGAALPSVTLTLRGPADAWFGFGFNASLMADAPYTIVVEPAGSGGSGVRVSERRLANHAAGTELDSSVTVLSNDVAGGVRTVVVRRPLRGASPAHYTFDPAALSLSFIAAAGDSATFGPHGDAPHGTAALQLWPSSSPVCVCATPGTPFGQGSGQIKYVPTGETVGFPAGRCPDQPRGDLIAQRNPTCDIRTYAGGQSTCHHGWHLLDADQEVPWPDRPLVYHKKFRVYFQEYNASLHRQITRADWGIGAGGNHDEYDVPQCAPGTPASECQHTITGAWAPVPAGGEDVYLAALHHHCHAPTCLRVETWNNDTGELLCRTEPVYGGTGGFVADERRFDEPGYVAIPSCMWGAPGNGLAPPPRMNGMTIRVVSVTNNTYGHHGEMALPQAMVYRGSMSSMITL